MAAFNPKKRWYEFTEEMIKADRYPYTTSTNYAMFSILKNLLNHTERGKVLDIGAGTLAFKSYLESHFDSYLACDIVAQDEIPLDFMANAEKLPLPSDTLDCAFLSAVLEHCREPETVLQEIYRVLKPEGRLILTVPHIHHIHGEPYDYYRFTRFGVEHILTKSQFRSIDIYPVGGAVSYLSTVISTGFISVMAFHRILSGVVYRLNKLWVTCSYRIDRYLDTNKKFALGYMAIAQK